jgi:hypothetical protein
VMLSSRFACHARESGHPVNIGIAFFVRALVTGLPGQGGQ